MRTRMRRLSRVVATTCAFGWASGVGEVSGQTTTDSVTLLAAAVDALLDPAVAAPYLGTPPYRPHHPHGDVVSFCVVYGGFGTEWGPSRDASPAVVGAVAPRIERWFDLGQAGACERVPAEPSGLVGVVDDRGAPAVRVAVATVFESPTAARVHLGIEPGGFGAMGWACEARPLPDGGWSVRVEACAYYES